MYVPSPTPSLQLSSSLKCTQIGGDLGQMRRRKRLDRGFVNIDVCLDNVISHTGQFIMCPFAFDRDSLRTEGDWIFPTYCDSLA